MIITYRVFLLYLFLCFGFCFRAIMPVQLFIQNSLEDMVMSKRIQVRIELDKTDQYIYKDSLRFSIDVPGIELKSWQASIHPTTQYSLLFKRNKLIYPTSFTAEILFNFNGQLEQLREQFPDANMYVACLIYGKDGKNSARTLMVSCYAPKSLYDNKQTGTSGASELLESKHDHDQQNHEDRNTIKIEKLGSELLFFNELFIVWKKLTDPVKQFLGSSAFFVWYIILLLLSILFSIKPYFRWMRFIIPFRGIWEKELKRFVWLLVTGASFYFLSSLLELYIILYSFACFLLICSFYYFRETTYSTTFLGKLKIIIGFICALFVLPILLKAFFLHKHLFFH